ncbi:metallophosphoesterase [Blastococcus sp. MG754426]|uniref:metallophosphoesterase n=1 Tax=unclassified Blastococcus TaxID=2619396 RepID=UPI0027152C30|nr:MULTISPECIES: metallophosphoesterase [unclassified Blastococcus]MCF6507414.1 metallophosphoesterase [Blastococcus sp. MG754426]MCF6512038.1 metallophosphoesterase [Blastococcus sp. MG754427]
MTWLTRTAAALGVLVVLLIVYGVLVEPRLILDRERLEVPLPQLAGSAGGTEVGMVSDFQVGMWWSNEGMVSRAVEELVEAAPDIALLGGDYVYSEDPGIPEQVATVMDLLQPLLDSGIPTYAVLGNHDYGAGAAEELATAFEEAGITVLRNEAAAVPGTGAGAEALHVVGIGAAWPGEVDVDAALAEVPEEAPRVVLMHNPTVFPELPAGTAPITLAGHTHCGQVALPGTPRWSYLGLTAEEAIVADGWAPETYGAESNRMFVSCGLGFSTVPIRINAPPQLVLVELRADG